MNQINRQPLTATQKAPLESVSYGSASQGGPSHLAAVMSVRATGLKMVHIPYKGSGPALPDLLSGQIGMMFMDYAPAKAQMGGAKLKALAVMSPQATPVLPGIPPLAATYPGYEAWFWIGLGAPKGTPVAVIDQLHEAYFAAVSDPAMRQKLVEAGIEPLKTSGSEMDAFVKIEATRQGKVIQEAQIRLH